jgi:cytochrome c oxidase subunit 2
VSRCRRVSIACLLIGLTACGRLGLPRTPTGQGREIADLWRVFFIAAVIVAGIVYALIVWSVARYRKRGDGPLPPQFRDKPLLEVTYVLIPLGLVTALFVLTFRTEHDVERLVSRPAATVHVTAFDWSWRFDYEGEAVTVVGTPGDPPELVLPVGRTVRIELRSEDVIHSFYIPSLLFKRDAIPGRSTRFDLLFERPIVDSGKCAEFCGLDHARMRFILRAVPFVDYRAWLTSKKAEAAA